MPGDSGTGNESENHQNQQRDLISSVNFTNQGDFREGSVLGEGGFGLVTKIIHRQTRLVFACKAMVYTPEKAVHAKSFHSIIDDGHQEIESHRSVRHPNIVRCFGGWVQQTGTEEGDYDVVQGELICKFSIILELMTGGTLSNVILKSKTPPVSAQLHRWTFQISLGLKAIHDRGFAHFDLKPDNVLFTGQLNAKLADLGGMEPAGDQRVRTRLFAAPEKSDRSGPPYDMFALGLIILCSSLRMTICDENGRSYLAVTVAGMYVEEKLKMNPAFDLKNEPSLYEFFQTRTMACVLVANLIKFDPADRFSVQQCLTEMAKVPPDQFSVGDCEKNDDPNDVDDKLAQLTREYSEVKFEEIFEPANPKRWIRTIVFSTFLLAAFLAVLTQFSIVSSKTQIPSLVGGYLIMSMVLSIIFAILVGSLLIYTINGEISTYLLFFCVYIVDIILSIVLAGAFNKRGEKVRLALAVIYTMSKIIAAYIPFNYIKLTSSLICGIIHSVQFLFKRDFRSICAVVLLTLALQICILFLGLPYVVEPWLLPTGSPGSAIFAAFVNLYVFLWLLNIPRYCLHYLCVSLFRNSFSQIKSTSPIFNAAYDCVLESGLGILVVSLFSVISPVCSFAVSVFTSLMWVSAAVAVACATCVENSSNQDDGCVGMCASTAFVSAAVGAASFFLVEMSKWLLTYVTKLNLTTMVILKVGYWKASKLTELNKKVTKKLVGSASLVTENIISAHISNICVLIGGLMFVIVDQFMPATAFYALITGYVIARTVFEPVDAWVLTAYAVSRYMPELLPALTGSLKLQQEFEAIRKLVQGNDIIGQNQNEALASENKPPEPEPAQIPVQIRNQEGILLCFKSAFRPLLSCRSVFSF